MDRGSANHHSSMEQTIPIGRSACLCISRGLIGLFGKFMRMLPTLCLNPVLMSCKIKKISTILIAELVQFFSWVFHLKSLIESLIVLLLGRSGWGFRAIMRGPHRSKPDSTRCTRESMRTSPSLMVSLSMPCFLAFRPSSPRCEQIRHNYLMMIMRGHSSFYVP
jgi:hypothetical protein